MADKTRWIIGQGESLIEKITIKSGPQDKAYPYEYDEAVDRLEEEIDDALDDIDALPDLACPNDEAVIAVTLHPSFLAKSYHPKSLLKAIGARQVGSRETRLYPEIVTSKKAVDRELVSAELFVAGPRDALSRLRPEKHLRDVAAFKDDFRKIESVRAVGKERIKRSGLENGPGSVPLEVVLHGNLLTDEWLADDVVDAFEAWCGSIGTGLTPQHVQSVGGLTFLGMRCPADLVEEVARFSFLRAVRRMPRLAFRDVGIGAEKVPEGLVDCSQIVPISDAPRTAILDGGLPDEHPFGDLVTVREPLGIGAPHLRALEHGVKVTSAMLFGSIESATTPPDCFAEVDHWRVYDEDDVADFELLAVLDRVMTILNQNRYDVACLSMGPDEAMIDDDVHVWTARLDEYAANGQTLIVSAAGNNGLEDSQFGANRVQPSSDGVNVLAVGARDCLDQTWSKADYSPIGPGRSPGLVKPDLVAFGGAADKAPFAVIGPDGLLCGAAGTSYAAPSVARLASGLLATFENQVTAMALKALLIHHTESDGQPQLEVGWGSVPHDVEDLMVCRADEATVIYQGTLQQSRHMRFPLPMPAGRFKKRTTIRATFVVATPTDPEDSVNYTRTGVGITFRPSTVGHPGFHPNGNERSTHESKSFFGKSQIFQTEQELRDDASRWEAVLKSERRFNASTLNHPVFDVEHLARAHGQAATRSANIPYALIVSVREPGNLNLYNRILTTYGNKLRALEPRIGIQVRS